MERALYGPDGFYTSGRGRAGRRHGDFITSPEVGPLFGEILARWVDRVWWDMDRPAHFDVYDLGAGPGTLLQSMRMAEPPCAKSWELHGVDLSAGTRLPDDLGGSVVVANEVLDNIPFRWVRRESDNAQEAWVDRTGLQWRPAELDTSIASGEFPLIERATALLSSILAAGAERVLVFDYGAPVTQTLADRGGWLRCYRGHERRNDPVAEPGRWDITTDVPLDQLPPADRVRTQAEFCDDHGLDDLVEAGRAYWVDHAAAPDTTALRMRSRVREAEALTDSDGLGAFWAAEWSGTPSPLQKPGPGFDDLSGRPAR